VVLVGSDGRRGVTGAPTNAQVSRLRWCSTYGHTWPPLREANPGDEHWCHFCGSRRVIGADGRVFYEREWD
jgi:hypothetical protein